MDKLLDTFFLGGSTIANAVLALDPHALEKLATLEGKVLGVTVTDLGMTFYCSPGAAGCQFSQHVEGKPDASLQGSALTLFMLLNGGSLESGKISLEGDLQFVQTIQQLFKALDLDWEEPLSQVVGDTVAHQIGLFARKSWRAGRRVAHIAQQNTQEHLQEEYRLLPPRVEIEDFCDEVNKLRMDTDRVEARWKRLQQQLIQ